MFNDPPTRAISRGITTKRVELKSKKKRSSFKLIIPLPSY